MEIPGRVRNGVVILEGGPVLPEGMTVTVYYSSAQPAAPAGQKRRVELPLVRSEHPGSLTLTAERVAELLEESDVSA